MIGGSGGIYDIVVDGVMLFSKKKEGRFPDAGEIEEMIREIITSDP